MITHSFVRGWNNGGSSISKTIAVQSGAELNIDESIPALTTDQLVAFAMDVSQLKGLYIVSDLPLTLETNSAGSPANTITLGAGVPYMWVFGDAAIRDTAGAVITTDITALYATNPHATQAAILEIRALYDPTV
jgi:hypothetical protein